MVAPGLGTDFSPEKHSEAATPGKINIATLGGLFSGNCDSTGSASRSAFQLMLEKTMAPTRNGSGGFRQGNSQLYLLEVTCKQAIL